MATKFPADQIAFADAIERHVSAAMAAFVRRRFDAGYSLAEVKEELRAAGAEARPEGEATPS